MRSYIRPLLLAAALALTGAVPLRAQVDAALTPGDVVRVDHEFVGTVMSIDDANLTLLGEGKPRCWPGIQHGEAPRCDPAPSVRRVVDWRDVTVERMVVDRSYTKRTIVGFLIGAGVGVPLGYVTGPMLGYGKIDGCVEHEETSSVSCLDPIPTDVAEARQRTQDQKRGAVFVGAIVATAGAIVARRMVDEWVQVEAPALAGDGTWSLGVRLPLGN